MFLVVYPEKQAFQPTFLNHKKISKYQCAFWGHRVHKYLQRARETLRGEKTTAITTQDSEMNKRPTPFGSAALVDADEIAQFLGCSPKHVRRMAERGQFPKPVKVGRLKRWPREAIEEWIDSQQENTPNEYKEPS